MTSGIFVIPGSSKVLWSRTRSQLLDLLLRSSFQPPSVSTTRGTMAGPDFQQASPCIDWSSSHWTWPGMDRLNCWEHACLVELELGMKGPPWWGQLRSRQLWGPADGNIKNTANSSCSLLKQVNLIISENIVNVIIQVDGEEPLYFAEMLLMKA